MTTTIEFRRTGFGASSPRACLLAAVAAAGIMAPQGSQAVTFTPLIEAMMEWHATEMLAVSALSGSGVLAPILYDYTLDLNDNTFTYAAQPGSLFEGSPFVSSATGSYDPGTETTTIVGVTQFNPTVDATGSVDCGGGGDCTVDAEFEDNNGNTVEVDGTLSIDPVGSTLATTSTSNLTLTGTLPGASAPVTWTASGRDRWNGRTGQWRIFINVPANDHTPSPIIIDVTDVTATGALFGDFQDIGGGEIVPFVASGSFESTISPVPLPPGVALLGGALLLGAGLGRRSRSAAQAMSG